MAEYKGQKIGTLADLTVFSFHPVKHITTGEGGMIVTDDSDLAGRIRGFRNHGITTDYRPKGGYGLVVLRNAISWIQLPNYRFSVLFRYQPIEKITSLARTPPENCSPI